MESSGYDEYVEFVKSLGFKVKLDVTKQLNDCGGDSDIPTPQVYDIALFCTSPNPNKDKMPDKVLYHFYAIGTYSELAIKKFARYQKEDIQAFTQGIKNRMLPYTSSDIVATLLHAGYNIQDVWVDNKLKLNVPMICQLMLDINSKGSPIRSTRY